MQESVSKSQPTLAVQLPHTVKSGRTWKAAWGLFQRLAGPDFRVATTAIRYLDQQYKPVPGPFDPAILGSTGAGERVVDIVVGGRIEVMAPSGSSSRAPITRSRTASRGLSSGTTPDRGLGLARVALEVFKTRIDVYPNGIRLDELAEELALADKPIFGASPLVTLRSALNGSQVYGVWHRKDGAMWVSGSGQSKMVTGLSGRPLAEALYAFVKVHYPSGVFHYEKARVELESSGVLVMGTGRTTRAALAGAPDLFDHVSGSRGYWRWK